VPATFIGVSCVGGVCIHITARTIKTQSCYSKGISIVIIIQFNNNNNIVHFVVYYGCCFIFYNFNILIFYVRDFCIGIMCSFVLSLPEDGDLSPKHVGRHKLVYEL
jgi:hypothetical protein